MHASLDQLRDGSGPDLGKSKAATPEEGGRSSATGIGSLALFSLDRLDEGGNGSLRHRTHVAESLGRLRRNGRVMESLSKFGYGWRRPRA